MFGTVVVSTAGRDKGYHFIVTKLMDNYVYIVDGNIHKVENPKYKKIKHIEIIGTCDDSLKQRIINNNKITNQTIKKALSKFENS
ncbi:MAG: KOW domain-containing RNA-binding protein [Clostridia bacterium]|nr:KOW domain-containing RNA-binding protein [Clostridia bacterium]